MTHLLIAGYPFLMSFLLHLKCPTYTGSKRIFVRNGFMIMPRRRCVMELTIVTQSRISHSVRVFPTMNSFPSTSFSTLSSESKSAVTAVSYASGVDAKPERYTPSNTTIQCMQPTLEVEHTVDGRINPFIQFVNLGPVLLRIQVYRSFVPG